MTKLAETLQAARQQSGLTLERVEHETRIRLSHLHALETDNFRALPPPVYTRGFVRNYAEYLRLDADYMVRLYDEAIGYRPQPVELAPRRPVRIAGLIVPNVAAIGVMVAVAGIVFVWLYSALFVNDQLRSARLPTPVVPTPTALAALVITTPTATSLPATATTSPSNQASPTAVPMLTRAPVVAGVATSTTSLPGASAQLTPAAMRGTPTATIEPGTMALRVRVVDAPSWVQIRTDGVVTFSGTLPQGAERTFNAKTELFIHAGRADAIELALNGVPQGRLGSPGQAVVRRTFSRADVV